MFISNFRPTSLAFILALPWLVACSTPSSEADEPSGEGGSGGAAPSLPEPSTAYYSVESTIVVGTLVIDETYVARRHLDPTAGTIDELFTALADGTETDTDLVVDADAASFTLTINAGEFVGEGQFTEGDAWAWTAWTSTSTGTDGTRVVSTDTVTATGISASKEGFNTDGELEWTLDEELTTISQAEYQAALDALPK